MKTTLLILALGASIATPDVNAASQPKGTQRTATTASGEVVKLGVSYEGAQYLYIPQNYKNPTSYAYFLVANVAPAFQARARYSNQLVIKIEELRKQYQKLEDQSRAELLKQGGKYSSLQPTPDKYFYPQQAISKEIEKLITQVRQIHAEINLALTPK